MNLFILYKNNNNKDLKNIFWFIKATTPPQVNKLDEFTEADHMLRPPPKKELSIMSFHKKHFRKSRFENYEDVGNGVCY